MKKRFTDGDKWDDEWFMSLDPKWKLFWCFILDKCDNAGVFKPNFRMASFVIGEDIIESDALEQMGHRVKVIDGGKWYIPSFIPFQCGKLSPACKPHLSIIRILESHGFEVDEKGYPKGIDTLQEKETEKEIDKKRKGTSDECAEYAAHIELPESDGHWFFDSMEACGWTRGGKPLKCWKSHMRAWKRAGHMASQKGMPVGAAGRDYTLLKDGTRIDGGIVIGGKLTTLRKA